MKIPSTLLFLSMFLCADFMPSGRLSCYRKILRDHNCRRIPGGMTSLRPIDESLQEHLWEGKGCEWSVTAISANYSAAQRYNSMAIIRWLCSIQAAAEKNWTPVLKTT